MRISRKLFVWALAIYLLLSPLYAAVAFQRGRAISINRTKNQSVLHIKFDEDADVAIKDGRFVSQAGKDLSAINEIIKPAPGRTRVSDVFKQDDKTIDKQRKQIKRRSGRTAPDLNSYFKVELVGNTDSTSLSNELKDLAVVEEAYPEPLPAPAPSPNFTGLQKHLAPASSNGMGINESSIYPGVSGNKVQIADAEYSWNTQHEDISDARQAGAKIANGTASDPFHDTNHGTAVTGILNGDKNSFGINGIVPNAQLKTVNTYSLERGWDVANAVYMAAASLSAGDVLLIEQQTWGPDGSSFVPVEWVPATYDAIKFATDSGIIVIEPAGNSNTNLDNPAYGSTFPMGKPDSGAIIVGAGTACNGSAVRNRMYYSNYGSRVNLQSYGECVVTSGYGYLYASEGQNAWYTQDFNGTSSASALVAGVAAALASSYEQLNGSVLTPQQVRSILISTGTPQDYSTSGGYIGPLPNLREAVKKADLTGPSKPTRPTATQPKVKQVKLSWKASTDNVKVAKYEIYRNGKLIGSTSTKTYLDKSGLQRRRAYRYTVRAVDVTGHKSAHSSIRVVKTR